MIQPRQTVLFQGDSITDAGRIPDYTHANHIHGLGSGYALHVASTLLSMRPADGLKFYNRGISGNRVYDLLARWRKDAIHLKPDWISILIGVNDTWHKFVSDTGDSLEIYEEVYRLILKNAREELPGMRFVLCEPFAVVTGDFKQEWKDEVVQRAAIVRKLAKEFDAVFVPFQQLFDELLKEAPAEHWISDGVHPEPGGHFRMAEFWKKHVGA